MAEPNFQHDSRKAIKVLRQIDTSNSYNQLALQQQDSLQQFTHDPYKIEGEKMTEFLFHANSSRNVRRKKLKLQHNDLNNHKYLNDTGTLSPWGYQTLDASMTQKMDNATSQTVLREPMNLVDKERMVKIIGKLRNSYEGQKNKQITSRPMTTASNEIIFQSQSSRNMPVKHRAQTSQKPFRSAKSRQHINDALES